MSDYWAGLANCLILGEEFTETETQQVRNLIRLNLDGIEFEIHQAPGLINNYRSYEGHFVNSTSVWVRNLAESDFERVERIARDISELLSFACGAQIRKYGYKFDRVAPTAESWAIPGVARYWRPVLISRSGDIAREFLEKTWPQYHLLRDPRQLNVVFDYLALNQLSEIPQELQLTITFTTLENLKCTYANSQKIPFEKGYFRKVSSPPKSDPAKEPKYGFEELLNLMFSERHMTPGLSTIIDLRNDIIHSGISLKSFERQNEILGSAQDIIREYLLKLLGYTGQYSSYSQPNGSPLTI
ncbi:MAG: hypothetical protein SF097_19700 [Acidobacteriota bacterium]|nr:hypothetical protein [Acidobacteriota bacterium]